MLLFYFAKIQKAILYVIILEKRGGTVNNGKTV